MTAIVNCDANFDGLNDEALLAFIHHYRGATYQVPVHFTDTMGSPRKSLIAEAKRIAEIEKRSAGPSS